MTNKNLAIFVALVPLIALAGCDLFTNADTRVARADQLLESGAYSEAMVELKTALDDQPANARALLLLARTNLQLGRYDPALKALADARQAGAPDAAADEVQASLLLARGQFDELSAALSSGSLALADSERDVMRARMLVAQDHCDQALPMARSRLAADVAQPELRVVLAECLSRRGNTDGALAVLQAATAATPDRAALWLARGRLQQVLGDKRDAEASWLRAAELAPGQLSVPQQAVMYSALADMQIAAGNVEGVRRTHRAMLAIAPGSPITGLLAAQLQLLEGKQEEAVSSAQRLVSADAEFAAARVLLVSSLLSQGTLEQARQQVALLVGKQPKATNLQAAGELLGSMDPDAGHEPDYWVRVAAAQSSLGQPAMAKVALERALKLAPDSLPAATALAGLELRMGDTDAAMKRAAQLVKQFPEAPAPLAVLADARAIKGEYALAAENLESLYSREPSAALAAAAHRVHTLGKLGGEHRLLERWLAAHPEDAAIRTLYAESLRTSGDLKRAATEFEAVVAKQPHNAAALNNLAWNYHLLGDARALVTARRAFELAPQSASVADTYGWLQVQAGSIGEALKILQVADQQAGARIPEIRYHYAVALARNGDRERARLLLEDLLTNSARWSGDEEAKALLRTLADSNAT